MILKWLIYLQQIKIADVTFQSGADAIIVHGFVGWDSVESCLESAKKLIKTFSF